LTDTEVPEPPDPATLDPLLKVWPSGVDLWRVHKLDRRPAEFNPGVDVGRFHPFSGSAGKPVATLYAASTWQGAVAETVFRNVPLREGPRTKRRAELELCAMSLLRLRRESTCALGSAAAGRVPTVAAGGCWGASVSFVGSAIIGSPGRPAAARVPA